jgi:hypothetical protein
MLVLDYTRPERLVRDKQPNLLGKLNDYEPNKML